jgi:uncharacterized repeat protein (TIGR04076 family)
MENYLPDLNHFFIESEKEKLFFFPASTISVQQLLEIKICPYLLHTLIPYIVTLSQGGVFHWMASQDPEAVVITCPNPRGCVVGCLKWHRGSGQGAFLELTIRSRKGTCLYGHVSGQKIVLPVYQDYRQQYHLFDVVFPWLIYGTVVKKSFFVSLGNPLGEDGQAHGFYVRHKGDDQNVVDDLSACTEAAHGSVVLKSCRHRCRYHKGPKRLAYGVDELVWGGLCPDFFHVAYPLALSRIYEGGFNVSSLELPEEVFCPNAHVGMRMRLYRKPLKSAAFRSAAVRFLNRIGYRADWPFYEIIMEITGGAHGCPLGHRLKQKFTVNLGRDMSLCPAAFDAFYPLWHVVSRSPDSRQSLGVFSAAFEFQCPDIVSQNVYQWKSAYEK